MVIKKEKRWKKLILSCILVAGTVLLVYIRQRYGAHGTECFVPDYPKEELAAATDYEMIFLQTGLGPLTVQNLLEKDDMQTILDAQEDFFAPKKVNCASLIGWFTREDKLALVTAKPEEGADEAVARSLVHTLSEYPVFADLQPGDILVTLSTHSAGWRHGHAALVLDENTTVESVMWGVDSTCGRVENWLDYANWAVLRVKDATPELQQQVAEYAKKELCGAPYHLSAGFIGAKAPKTEAPYFGGHCAYLVWYAWNHFGYDLDSDGGRLVTANDLLHSDLLEVVQLYGMDPREFVEQ